MPSFEPVFLRSAPSLGECPVGVLPEFALIGRSNVGKSTLVNLLAGRRALARVSATPGRTRLLNFFQIHPAYLLVDLPGYGFAKLHKGGRELLQGMVAEYLAGREALRRVLVLIDSRLPPQKIDLEFLAWLAEHRRPCALVFTKADKVKPGPAAALRDRFLTEVAPFVPVPPPVFVTSAKSKNGLGPLRHALLDEARSVGKS
jgi:GTP-binding protein